MEVRGGGSMDGADLLNGNADGLLKRYFELRQSNKIGGTETVVEEVRKSRGMMEDGASKELRAGEGYRIYRAGDTGGRAGEEYERVVRRVARWAGVPEGYVESVVEGYENRVARWWERELRQHKGVTGM